MEIDNLIWLRALFTSTSDLKSYKKILNSLTSAHRVLIYHYNINTIMLTMSMFSDKVILNNSQDDNVDYALVQ